MSTWATPIHLQHRPGHPPARSLCCRAACRACARSGAVPGLVRAPMARPCRSGSPMPGRRGRQTPAGVTSWSSPGTASRPARSPAHADGTAARPGLPGSAPRRSGGPCRKDQRPLARHAAHRIRTGRLKPPSIRQANSSCCDVKAGEVNGYLDRTSELGDGKASFRQFTQEPYIGK